MKYFYIFILTLILISCNEKKGYGTTIEYGDIIKDISESECRDVVVKGKIIRDIQDIHSKNKYPLIYYKGYIYKLQITYKNSLCFSKRKFHDKWINF